MPHAVPSSAGLVLYTGTRSDSSSGTTEEAGPSTTTATGDHWAISWVSRGSIQSVPVRLSMTSTWYKPSGLDRKSTRLNSSHVKISYAVFCLKKKNMRARDRHGPVQAKLEQ